MNYKRRITLGLLLVTLSLVACSQDSAQLQTQANGLSATFGTSSKWDSGFNGVITLSNATGAVIKGWTLKFKFNGNAAVSGTPWGAGGAATKSADGFWTVTPNAWGGDTVPANGSVTVSYDGTGTFSGVNSCTLNGASCDAGGTAPPPAPSGIACFFENTNYSGASFCADADSSWVGTAWNDRVSSVKVQSGYQVQLFGDVNYGGASKTLAADAASLPDFNDQASSFKVTKVATTPPPPNMGGYKRVGYFVQWGIYGRNYKLVNMDQSGAAATLTHLNYAFGGITPEGTCTVTAPGISDSFADYTKSFASSESVDGVGDTWDQKLRGNFNQLKKLKAKHPNLKVLISLGGWTWSKNFSDVALSDASRKKFVSSCVDLYIRGNLPSADGAGGPGTGVGVFDGIDIDWEYPASEGNTGNVVRPEDTRNFTLLLEEFRRQLDATGSGKLLTAALPGAPSKIAKLEVPNISRTLDLMNVMTYDFRGGWATTGPTNFHSNLYTDPASPGGAEEKTWSGDLSIRTFLQAGAPANKLILGIPYYGRGWTGVGGANNGLYQNASGLPQGAYEAGIDDYKVLVNKPGTVYRNDVTKQLWKYDGSTFWSYDDPQVIAEKTAYIKQKGLGGSMAWSMDGDDANASLSKAIFNGLR